MEDPRSAAASQRRAVDVALLRAGLGSMLPVRGARAAARMTTRAIREAGFSARGGKGRDEGLGEVGPRAGMGFGGLPPVSEEAEGGTGAALGGAKSGGRTLAELEVIRLRGADEAAGSEAVATMAIDKHAIQLPSDDASTSEGEDEDEDEDDESDDSVDTEERFCSKLHALWKSYELPPAALTDLLSALQSHPDMDTDEVPATASQLERRVAQKQRTRRPRCATFGHSLERNGANNFLLYLVRSLQRDGQEFELFSPKEGPMRGDFEAMGVPVHVVDTTTPEYMVDLRAMLERAKASRRFGCCFANTIMRAEVVALCKEVGLPSAWTIHEAWPKD